MKYQIGHFDGEQHERDKKASRAADNARLAAGDVSLKQENSAISGGKIDGHRVVSIGGKPLGRKPSA